MYVYTTTTKIVFLVVIEHFSLFCRLSFLYDFKGVFDMVEKKTDRRILKTKRALRESLLYLLKEQPIQKISVSRLCEKSADPTFFLGHDRSRIHMTSHERLRETGLEINMLQGRPALG